ncbi:MAG: hypothetical protein GXO78_05855 [Calditrichaeota bacterium]|nr:hypothetical protein [Calditrichota bacterium]
MKRLIVLVPDKNTEHTLKGLLSRHQSFNIVPLSYRRDYDIFVHPERDPGVVRTSVNFLRAFQRQYEYAMVFFDFEGSGLEDQFLDAIENNLKSDLERSGWKDRVEVFGFYPELEIWAWVQSNEMARIIGWEDVDRIRLFLKENGYWQEPNNKPHRPKEAFEHLLYEKRIQRSSTIYEEIAQRVSFRNCSDRTFLKFKQTLNRWFSI